MRAMWKRERQALQPTLVTAMIGVTDTKQVIV